MKSLYADPNSKLDINIWIESSKKNSYDTVYFGHIQILKYRTWAFFTQTQLDCIQKKVNLIQTSADKPKRNTSSGNHFSKKKAQDEFFYFNTIVFFIYYGNYFDDYVKRNEKYIDNLILKYNKENKQQNQIILFKQLPNNLLDIISDRGHIIYKDSWIKSKFANFERFNFCSELKFLDSIFNPMDLIPDSNEPNSFRKEFIKFWDNNKIFTFKNKSKEVNIRLISSLILIKEMFENYKFNSFLDYKKCIIKIFKHRSCFSKELNLRKDKSRFDDIKIIFNEFKGKNPLSCFLKWDFYSSYHNDIAIEVLKLKERGVIFSQYKNPFRSYNFLSSRYQLQDLGNFSLPCLEHKTFNVNKEIVLENIDNYQKLVSIGAALHNCAGSNETLSYYQKSISLIVNFKNKIKYLITIQGDEIRQFKGFKNSSPEVEMFNQIQSFLYKNGYINRNVEYQDACIQDYSGRI